LGRSSRIARATVNPPTPESSTPMGELFIIKQILLLEVPLPGFYLETEFKTCFPHKYQP